jgi:hypothetical protein
MEEKRHLQKLHGLFQFMVYAMICLEIFMYIYAYEVIAGDGWERLLLPVTDKLMTMDIYQNLLYSKLSILLAICLAAVGTLSKKELDLNPKKQIILPLALGLLLFFGSMFFYSMESTKVVFPHTTLSDLAYIVATLVGAVLTHTSLDNISKLIKSSLGKDEWNIEGESFMQPKEKTVTVHSVNIPMEFYYKKRIHRGWINLVNPFRGTLVIGTPGSGKSYGVVNPFIRQMVAKGFTMCLYDFKYPDLGRIAYYHYLLAKQNGRNKNYRFNVVNLDQVEYSRRINPIKRAYIRTLADASETAEAIVQSLQKSESSGGSDKFFTQSAVNFLASCIYFVSRHREGQFSTFSHLLAFLNRTYEEIFTCLGAYPELESLLSPFRSALEKRAFEQLEGQVGTLKIFISRLNTKETAWIFSGDDFDLKISSKDSPSVLVLANSPATQDINSTCYSVIVNRLTRLINTKGNLPVAIIADEAPTLYIHRVENLISTARSNKVAVLLGLQELPQLKQLQGKDTATTMTAVIGNVLSGSVRNKETLEWLERMFGKKKQLGESVSIERSKTSVSLSEKYDPLIPAGKIAGLRTGEMVGIIASDGEKFNGLHKTSNIHCRINLDQEAIQHEEQNYKPLPKYYDFRDRKEAILNNNFMKIREEVENIVNFYNAQG